MFYMFCMIFHFIEYFIIYHFQHQEPKLNQYEYSVQFLSYLIISFLYLYICTGGTSDNLRILFEHDIWVFFSFLFKVIQSEYFSNINNILLLNLLLNFWYSGVINNLNLGAYLIVKGAGYLVQKFNNVNFYLKTLY